jgi:hypothetical protein
MKTMNVLVLSILLFVGLSACKKDNKEPDNNLVEKFGEILRLKIGDSENVDGKDLIVKFNDIIEDSRCPETTECVWEGQVRVHLTAEEKELELILRAGKENLAKDTLNNIVYTLLSVTPYPGPEAPIAKEDYEIELKVDKL